MAEFLPLCDVLFNVISLAGYFCDVVFDVVMGYALLERGYKGSFAAAMSIIVTSLLISQVLSLRWYLHAWSRGPGGRRPRAWLPVLLHGLQLGVLWRYARLFVPNDLRQVKHQVRDLCMLRLVHAFCEAAPMLLLQLHVLVTAANVEVTDVGEATREPAANKAFAELNVISASLSLFSVCWALASFSKNVRLQNVHRLVLTWLGVIFQFVWRLGTISARMCALTVYALVYEYWVFLVIGLHWVSMFLWLISPRNVFHGERLSRPRKAYLSGLIAYVYVFAYINLQDNNHRQKMVTFYLVMLIENCLLVGASASSRAALFSLSAFALGIAFMLLYYRYFHVRRLGYILRENQQGTNSTDASSQNKNGKQSRQGDDHAVPGVFNCRFTNPVGAAHGRKKKKPTSFVPPPAPPAPASSPSALAAPASAPAPAALPAPAPAPAAAPVGPAAAFWRRPLPATHHHHGGSSENEGSSVGSRVNIQQKLQEKKQKQLAELRVIEEEIKQGKLAKTTPVAAEEIYSSLQRQPIPRAKTHAETTAWPSLDITHSYQNYPLLPHNCNIYPTYTEIKAFDFQNGTENDIKRRIPNRLYEENPRTFYDDPANLDNVPRTALRTNYLVGESRSYETNNCGSPRTVNNSPRAYAGDVSSAPNSYERPTTTSPNPRLTNGTYGDARPNLEYYCESKNQIYTKDEYLQSVQGIDRTFNENNPSYVDRFVYPVGGKAKLEQMRKMQRCRTPEILLAPHYLEGCNRQVCCHWGAPAPYNIQKEGRAGSSGEESARDTPRPHSDIDSQISLPRSYTLPREFRYWRRRARARDACLPSNNSSDGDVDSGDENASCRRSGCSGCSASPHTEHTPHTTHTQHTPHTDLTDRTPGHHDRRRRSRKQKPETKL